MIALCLLLTAAAAMSPLDEAGASTPLVTLDALRWERRVLLVFVAPEQRAAVHISLMQGREEMEDRDMTWLLLERGRETESNHPGPVTSALTARLFEGLAPVNEPLDVLLIGKDGGLKHRGASLDLEARFTQIDGMPMRRQELRAREQAAREPNAGTPER